MNDLFAERDLLRTIDPAHNAGGTEHDRLRNLNTVLQRVKQRERGGVTLPNRFWMGAVLPVALVATAAAVVYSTMPTPMLTLPSLFGAGPAQRVELVPGYTTQSGVVILASVAVDDSQIYLGQRGDQFWTGGAIDGGDPDSNVSLVQPVASVAVDGLERLDGSNFPDAAPGGVATFVGQIGADVVGVDVRTFDGDIVNATIVDDFALAAWEGRDGSEGFTDGQQYVLHLRDGTTKILTQSDLTAD